MNKTTKQILGLVFVILFLGVFTFLVVEGVKNSNTAKTSGKAAQKKVEQSNNKQNSAEQNTKEEKVQSRSYSEAPKMQIDQAKTYLAKMETSKGVVTIELFAKEVPITVNNFVFLARDGFYNGTIFHRIIKGFMIQGGDPLGNGTGGPGYKFNDEKITRGYTRGTIAMANSGPNTNGSQFFIMHKDISTLPKNYVIFGKVIEGLDVVDKIAEVSVTSNDSGETSKPTENVVVNKVTIEER